MRKVPETTDKLPRKAPDTTTRFSRRLAEATAKLSRAALATGAAAGKAVAVSWPAPPYYDYAEPRTAASTEYCLLTFMDQTTRTGALLQFSPNEATLTFRQEGAGSGTRIAFDSLMSVELLRPVQLKRESLPGSVADRFSAESESQPFTVEFVNGEVVEGRTVGHVKALCGLFLFLPRESSGVMRHFVPSHVVRSHAAGKPIGEMLMERNLVTPESVDSALREQLLLRNHRLGEYLTENRIVSHEQLSTALERQRSQPGQKLGETLVGLGYLSAAELQQVLEVERRDRAVPLGRILTDMGVLEPDALDSVMAKKLGIPMVKLAGLEIAPDILKRMPAAVAYRYHAIPLAESDLSLVVAVEDPMNAAKMDELRFAVGAKLVPAMASASDIGQALKKNYGARDGWGMSLTSPDNASRTAELPPWRSTNVDVAVEELTARLSAESADLELNEKHAEQSDTTLVKLVNKIILDAVAQNASDIHIEANPGEKGTRIRFRKDGALVHYLDLPARFRRAVVSRLKIMSQLDITERRRPQDGKIEFSKFGPARVELRVATVPTTDGLEDVVMRVLSGAKPLPIDQIGFDPVALATLKQLMARPHGLFLVCGPTGSGKTTTLHSLLGHLNTDERKIWTAEDPIEISQPGLRQVQVNAKIGWTFAAAMRSFMRADPDVIMVGEMRDAETAKIGVEASLTGHLVLSTLHTNSAAESVVRLLDLGMDPFNFADALLGVLSQRLVRRLCPHCRQAYSAPQAELAALASEYCVDSQADADAVLGAWRVQQGGSDGGISLYRAKGCGACDQTGYKGRMGVYEFLVADAPLKSLVQRRAPISEIHAAAQANGMRTLKQDGIGRVLQGLTDIHHVRMVY